MKKYWAGILTVVLGLCLIGHAGLIAHYSFDDENNLGYDDSGNEHHLSVYSGYGTPGYTADGIEGGATSLNSGGSASEGWITDQYILTPSFTFSTWVKPMGTSSMVVQPWSLSSGYQIYVAGGVYRFATMSSEGTSYKITSSSPTIGSWQHIAMTFAANGGPDVNGTYTGVITAYVDGEIVGTLEDAKYAAPTIGYLALGRRSSAYFNGTMDEVSIYDTALSQAEIQSMIPEPASMGLLGLGAVAVWFLKRHAR